MQLETFADRHQDAAERGRALGQARAERLRDTSQLYIDFFGELGLDSGRIEFLAMSAHEALAGWRPALAVELEATAHAADLPVWRLAAVNARTEILAAAGAPSHECSTLVLDGGNHELQTFQTWDWHGELAPYGLVWDFMASTGMRVKTFTEYGAQAKIGVNEAGLGVHFNILAHAADTGIGGVPVHSVARAVLDEARGLNEAIAIIRSAPVSASTALTLVSTRPSAGGPRAVSVEMSPVGVGVVEPVDGVLLHTNHFLDGELAAADTIDPASKTWDRMARLEAVTRQVSGAADGGSPTPGQDAAGAPTPAQDPAPSGATTAPQLAASLVGEDGADSVLCFRPDPAAAMKDRWDTLLSISLDPLNFAFDAIAGSPAVAAHGMDRY